MTQLEAGDQFLADARDFTQAERIAMAHHAPAALQSMHRDFLSRTEPLAAARARGLEQLRQHRNLRVTH